MIEVRGLARCFGKVEAVRDVSFRAPDGRITGLLGANGAGKTTTLRMLYTLVRPDRGSVQIDAVDALADPAAARRRLGVLPDARGLYRHLTARENIEYFARLQGQSRTAAGRSSEDIIAALDLNGVADRRTEGFSQGERVRTALARALVHGPANLVLDEPTNGLDVMATRGLRDYLRRQRDAGRCVLFSSHVMAEVEALCDDVVVIARGSVVATGTVPELCRQAGVTGLEEAFVRLVDHAGDGA
jgi:sodium transport system ATP-binding protein